MSKVVKKPGGESSGRSASEVLDPLINTSEAADNEGAGGVSVGIVGCGRGGAALLDVLKDNDRVKVVWVADKDPGAKGIGLARELGIPVLKDFREVVETGVDVIIDATGSDDVSREIQRLKGPETELVGGASSKLMWRLGIERKKRYEKEQRRLTENECIQNLSLIMESIHSVNDMAHAIVDYATRLTKTSAGLMAVFGGEGETALVASKGCGGMFMHEKHRQEASARDLHEDEPEGVIRTAPVPGERRIFNTIIKREGMRTVLSAPLTSHGKIVGILQVADSARRRFDPEEVSLFSLLTLYAGTAVRKVGLIEEIRSFGRIDGLTGLYNRRYFMEQFDREVQRGVRHKRNLSLVVMDLDDDGLGHIESNRLLAVTARQLAKSIRTTDTAARIGDNRFCILAPETEKGGAETLARRLLEELSLLPPLREAKRRSRSRLKAGVATFPADGRSWSDLAYKAGSTLKGIRLAARDGHRSEGLRSTPSGRASS